MNIPATGIGALRRAFDFDRLTFWLVAALAAGLLCLFVGYPLLVVLVKSFIAGDGSFGVANYVRWPAFPHGTRQQHPCLAHGHDPLGIARIPVCLYARALQGATAGDAAVPYVAAVDRAITGARSRRDPAAGTQWHGESHLGLDLHIYGFWGIVVADTLYCLPQAVLMLATALAQADARPYEAVTGERAGGQRGQALALRFHSHTEALLA